ncbi:unnamed protein product [Menidia menidia]|uniref:(Atlantic silverside) hypothetical protein n=1 Tax=Menidia menidia TaxID=238744 RepID=A0A8S4AF77_9TELE|nr:unnamed protein product [Menidia menidia]
MDVDTAFLKSRRGIVKFSEMGTMFVAFVCFVVGSPPRFTAASALEFLITSLLLLFYFLKLNKRMTFFFWPLVDVFNSVFGAVYLTVFSLMAMTSYTVSGTLAGGILCLGSAGLLCVDSFTLSRNITFNRPRSGTEETLQ